MMGDIDHGLGKMIHACGLENVPAVQCASPIRVLDEVRKFYHLRLTRTSPPRAATIS